MSIMPRECIPGYGGYSAHDMTVWPVSEIQPVLMRAREDADLLEPVSWTYASRLTAVDAFPSDRLDYFGVPFSPKIRITSRVS